MEYNNQPQKLKDLIEINNMEQSKIKEQIVLVRSFYNFMGHNNISQPSLVIKDCYQPYISLPYLILVDFLKKCIYVKFHEKILTENNERGLSDN
ncbi:hypothetical protein J2Z26_003210 [Bacillus luteolus]|nr:hypothetical protein [Cytobacillus luteolus]